MTDTDASKDKTTIDTKPEDTETKEETANLQVHSANAWEDADLGDAERKNKFLRLMGAAKKEHHGRFVIGDHKPEHARDKNRTEKLQHELEDQYSQSMQHRMAGGRRGHIGLGFHDADRTTEQQDSAEGKGDVDNTLHKGDASATKEENIPSKEKDEEDDKGGNKKDELGEDVGEKSRSKKRDSSEMCSKDDLQGEKKLKFVKSSS